MTDSNSIDSTSINSLNSIKPVKVVVTHNGQFHMDEVTAIAMLKICYPEHTIEIVRTRNADVIKEAQEDLDKIVVDVGHVYDAVKGCYDHHQASFTEGYTPYYENITALSSCGLIFRHYAEKLVKQLATKEQLAVINIHSIISYVYKSLVLPIDAHDNGVVYGKPESMRFFPLELGVAISKLNGKTYQHEEQHVRFTVAVETIQKLVQYWVESAIEFNFDYEANLPAFHKAFNSRTISDVLVLDKTISNIARYLNEFDPSQQVKFIVCPKQGTTPLQWNLWTVNCKGERFKTLVPLISQDQAYELVGKENVVFVHKACFTGATFSKETAIRVAQESILKNWTPKFNSSLNSFPYTYIIPYIQFDWVSVGVGLAAGAVLAICTMRN